VGVKKTCYGHWNCWICYQIDDHLMVNDYPAIVMVKKNCYGQFDESFFLIINCNWMNGRKNY